MLVLLFIYVLLFDCVFICLFMLQKKKSKKKVLECLGREESLARDFCILSATFTSVSVERKVSLATFAALMFGFPSSGWFGLILVWFFWFGLVRFDFGFFFFWFG